ncbi:hypothetical protein, partial [Micropruina sp.]|uniref:hypothetical protein n=1 Tax=Micropruina sp. TaxID=2737536 RepID=UPI0026261ACC
EIDDLRVNLREAADGFRPALDADELAQAGRRRQRRNRIIGGVAGAAALLVVAGVGIPAALSLRPGIPASPAGGPSEAPVPGPSEEVQSVAPLPSADTSDWLTFSSPEYPVTFLYPPDWTVDDDLGGDGSDLGKLDGCDIVNCVLFVNPPDAKAAAPLELIRGGFDSGDSIGGGVTGKTEQIASIPDLLVWGADDATRAPAVLLTTPNRAGEPADYLLGASQPELTHQVAVGDSSPAGHPESRFLFTTNIGNIGGKYDEEGRLQVLTILGSTRPNPDFDPTQPVEDEAGDEVIEVFDTMKAPDLTVSSESWKSLDVKAANLSVRVPPKWKVIDDGEGVIWIKAPSGYIVDLLTNGGQEACSAGPLPGSEALGVVDGLEAAAPGLTGTPEIRWVNDGQYPVWIGLTLERADKACFERDLDFGGKHPVYLGSADNGANPTPKELDQAVAILASARRLS